MGHVHTRGKQNKKSGVRNLMDNETYGYTSKIFSKTFISRLKNISF